MEKKNFCDKFYNAKTVEIGRICFYIGLIFEMVIFFLDRADWVNPYQSLMFRITFIFFIIKCICTRYDKKQWIFIVLTAAFCILSYYVNRKDEMIRFMVFIISMKDLDVKRVLKLNLFTTVFGVILLGLLAVFGVCGSVLASPGYAEKADAFMVSFGLGSSNTYAIQIWLIIALIVYLYHDRFKCIYYLYLLIIGCLIYAVTKCRIELIMVIFTCLAGFLTDTFKKLREGFFIYLCGIIAVLACTAASVYAAKMSVWHALLSPLLQKIDDLSTGRISSLNAYENGGGVLSNWKPFGDIAFTEYFDMGYVRLFWWYGFIPGALFILAVIIVFVYQYKHKDSAGFILLVSSMIFTLIEAHFISPFIARSYPAFLIGGMWYKLICCRQADEKKHIAFYIGSLSKGGAERVFCNLAEYFLSIGFDVTMITQYIRENEYELPKGANRVISDLSDEEQKGRLYNFAARVLKLHRVIRDTDADLLMTTIGKANFMAITCAAFTKTRVVVSVVADPKEEYPNRIMKFLLQTLFGDADGIIMQTTDQRNFLRYGLRQEAVILPNAVSPAFVKDRYIGARPKDIYMVGRMDENKDQQLAVNAFGSLADKYPDSRLILIGDGDTRADLVKIADELNISDRVVFTGVVGDVPDRLYRAYAFVLTSKTEGMPNTLIEAMSLGIACISTNCPCGGPKDLIKDGENGLLFEVGDKDGCARAMDRLLADPDFADSLGQNAYEMMLRHRPETVNALWKDFYLSIINS